MSHLLWNILLALLWMSLQGRFSSANFVVGFAIGYSVLLICRPALPPSSYSRKISQVGHLVVYLGWHILLANLQIAWRVLNPRLNVRPAVIALPLSARTHAEIALLANLITLTPGTLSIDLLPDRSTLYIHVMHLPDPTGFKRSIKRGLERRVLEVLR